MTSAGPCPVLSSPFPCYNEGARASIPPVSKLDSFRITGLRRRARGRPTFSTNGMPSLNKHHSFARVTCSVGDHPSMPLPFEYDALAPYISESAMRYHHDHYLKCLRKLNSVLDEDDALKRLTLEDLIKSSFNNGNPLPVYNWASEAWNHQFFWTSLNPEGGNERTPKGELLEVLERDFGSVSGFKQQFRSAALSCFGSGWIWLSAKVETVVPEEWLRDLPAHNPYRLTVARLRVEKTSNAINPIVFDRIPLLALDMWEHAYFSDHKDNRAAYVDAFLDRFVSWDTVIARMENAKAYVNFKEMPTPKESLFRPGYVGDFALADAPYTKEKAIAVLSKADPPKDT